MRIKTLLITLVAVFMAVSACATVSTNAGRNEYTAGAAQTVFNYTFKIYADTDLDVYVTPVGQTPDDATDITTAYTVAGAGDDAGGSITLNSGTTSGDLVTIVSSIPSSRTIDYQFNGDFRPNVVNNDFDRAVSLVKQLENTSINTLKYQNSFQGGAGTLPDPEALKIIGYDSSGDLFNFASDANGGLDVLADLADNAVGKGSDLVAHTGTADTVTEGLAKKLPLTGGTLSGSLTLDDLTASTPIIKFNDPTNDTNIQILQNAEVLFINTSYRTGSALFTPLSINSGSGVLSTNSNRVLSVADEGTGNGLDADTVDGFHGSATIGELLGDGVAGRVLRRISITLQDGTNASTVKATVSDLWNGDTIAVTDNIAKGATTGSFTLSADGFTLSFPVTGNSVASLSATMTTNSGATHYFATSSAVTNDTTVGLIQFGATTPADISGVVDTAFIVVNIIYLTDA